MSLFDLAEAAADAGDVPAAAIAADELNAVGTVIRLPAYAGLAAGGSAWAGVAAGDPERAARCAQEAIKLLSSVGWKAHLARCHYALGRSLPADERADAEASLERAAAILGECGSTWRTDRSLEALRRLGPPDDARWRPHSAPIP